MAQGLQRVLRGLGEPRQLLADLKQLTDWFAAGQLKPVITERVPLSGAAAAIGRLGARQAMGKLVVQPRAAD